VPNPIPARPGRDRKIPLYLAMFADVAVNGVLCLAARGGTSWQHALWHLPDIGPILWQLRYSGPGYRPVRFFSRLDLEAGAGVERWRRVAGLVRWTSTAAGSGLPYPEHVPLAAPQPIIAWMRDTLRAGQTPNLMTTVSPAVSLCGLASEAGIDLRGVQLSVSGEPLTPGRLDALRRTGATPLPSFGAKESGLIAHGCLTPSKSDDLHLYHDVNAVITPGSAGAAPDLPADALLLSSLRQSWPIVLLNVSLGDRADLEVRACGCPLEQLGWTTHLHTIRSFEKMKVGGLAVPDAFFIRLLEEALPARFGGGPSDYQLVQEEAAIDGTAHLRLLIHPKVGPVDEDAVAETVLDGARHSGVLVEQLWATVRWLTVERRPTLLTAGGKLYHVHRRNWPGGR
jgi:hypothetical protein